MSIFFFGIEPHSPHLETQLELMEEHLAAGDEVIYLSCDRALNYCDANPENDWLFCAGCVGKRKKALGMLSRPVKILPLSELLERVDLAEFSPEYSSVDELRQLTHDGFDYGEAVASSLFSYAVTFYPDLEKYRRYIDRSIRSSVSIYFGLTRFFAKHPPQLAYAYNGRGSSGRGFVRACQNHSISFFTHERGSSIDSYVLIKNTIIHNVDYCNQAVIDHWQNNPDVEAKGKLAAEFYSRMRKGRLTYSQANYLKDQLQGRVPDIWLERSPRYVFFTSTETEMSALDGFFKKRIYPSLVDTLTRIVADLQKAGFQGVLLIRMHPNSFGEYETLKPRLEPLLATGFVHIVPPRESADTYALMDSADKVLTTYSTAGIEAAYAGKPSISLERSFYDLLGSVYAPDSHEEVMDLLLNPLLPKDKLGAIMYGYYTLTFGQKFRYVSMKGQTKCSFRGKKVRSPKWVDWAIKIRKKFKQN
ncbi:hypothetical protein [Azonexus sp. R2A61]|uniref:hypothetical protein n=1 Tax=Azonexus sp. R2A61 TaxID=2744443 RepID=UPI001F1F09B5|nr:hypothetical protein [Azonexus sp. R2A61]